MKTSVIITKEDAQLIIRKLDLRIDAYNTEKEQRQDRELETYELLKRVGESSKAAVDAIIRSRARSTYDITKLGTFPYFIFWKHTYEHRLFYTYRDFDQFLHAFKAAVHTPPYIDESKKQSNQLWKYAEDCRREIEGAFDVYSDKGVYFTLSPDWHMSMYRNQVGYYYIDSYPCVRVDVCREESYKKELQEAIKSGKDQIIVSAMLAAEITNENN